MFMEHTLNKVDVTKTVLPLTAAIAMLVTVAGGLFFWGAQNNEIENHTQQINGLYQQLKDVPSRTEYNDLKASVDKRFDKVDSNLEKISDKLNVR